jgi:hypothetical protein
MSSTDASRAYWKNRQLFIWGQERPQAEIVPDEKYPGMWRFRLLPDGRLSDMVNLSRVKDAARTVVVASWNRRQRQETDGLRVA